MTDAPPIEVLFLVPRLGGGGAERVIATLLTHLDRRRFRPVLLLQHRDGEYMDSLPSDVEILDLGGGHLRTRMPRLLALCWRRRPGILFTTLGYVNLLTASLRPLLPPGTIHVARETSIPAERVGKGLRDRVVAWLYRHRLPRVDLLICQSRDMVEDLIGTWGFPANRAAVVHNPVDLERIASLARAGTRPAATTDQIRLVAAGRLVPQKGFDMLLEALALTPARYHLTILGDGPERGALTGMVCDLDLTDRVRLLPFTPNPYPHMADADAVVLSSRHEGFPNVLLEAGACGTPVIAFRCPGGVDEIVIEGETGFMATLGDRRGLAKIISSDRYLSLDGDRIIAAVQARFSPEIIIPRYEDLLTKAASHRVSRHG